MSENKRETIDRDIQYLLKPEITNIIGQGLSILYNEQPEDPIDFLGKWLLKYSSVEAQRSNVKALIKIRKLKRN